LREWNRGGWDVLVLRKVIIVRIINIEIKKQSVLEFPSSQPLPKKLSPLHPPFNNCAFWKKKSTRLCHFTLILFFINYFFFSTLYPLRYNIISYDILNYI